jgi:hypothetical protein
MQLLAHRGLWKNNIDQNSYKSFKDSFINDFGVETDLRDHFEKIKISHDLLNTEDEPIDIDLFFKLYNECRKNNPLALNIKSDGLQDILQNTLLKYKIKNYFVFDMSIPDTINYIKKGFNVFSRQSEHELKPSFYNSVQGIWLDSFDTIWYNKDIILNHLSENKKVAIVSSELHKRDQIILWDFIKSNNFHLNENIYLCTDFPIEANIYFK